MCGHSTKLPFPAEPQTMLIGLGSAGLGFGFEHRHGAIVGSLSLSPFGLGLPKRGHQTHDQSQEHRPQRTSMTTLTVS